MRPRAQRKRATYAACDLLPATIQPMASCVNLALLGALMIAQFTLADGIQVVIAAFTGAAAVAAWLAASAASAATQDSKVAANDSKKAAQAELFSTLMAQYGSPEMGEALRVLTAWQKSGQPAFGSPPSFAENVVAWAKIAASASPSSAALQLHQHRRRITYFFSVVDQLLREGQLEEGFASDIQDLSGTNLLCTIVLPRVKACRDARGDAKPDDGGARLLERFENYCAKARGS